jgi:hypothetical protein
MHATTIDAYTLNMMNNLTKGHHKAKNLACFTHAFHFGHQLASEKKKKKKKEYKESLKRRRNNNGAGAWFPANRSSRCFSVISCTKIHHGT